MFKKLGLTTALVCACAAPAFADTAGLIRGVVTQNARPVPHMLVTLQGQNRTLQTYTDAAGRFRFADMVFGSYQAYAGTGQSTAREDIVLHSDGIADVDLTLGVLPEIGSTHSGIVRGPASSPVSVNTISQAAIAASPYSESLSRLIETVPGIVRFSYDEPVAHGFHGVTYELDGVPLPQSTASNFSDIIDPRTIDSMEVLTGAFPAEYGGERQGAVVNIVSNRFDDHAPQNSGTVTVGVGNYGSAETQITDQVRLGTRTIAAVGVNEDRTNRGIDSPTFEPLHDANGNSDENIRTLSKIGANDTLAVDAANSHSSFEVPININQSSYDSLTSPAGTDDVQQEYRQNVSLTYKHNAGDGKSYTQISPWYSYNRVRYDGDTANDLASSLGTSLSQDRHSTFTGLRIAHFQEIHDHALKAGVDTEHEDFNGNELISYYPTGNSTTPSEFADNNAQRGSKSDAYIQDKWTPTRYVSVLGGVRYDHSTGYVAGTQLSPRLEFNGRVGEKDILHGYMGRFYAAPFLEDTRRAATILNGAPLSAEPTYNLQPEHSSYYEFGLAHTMTDEARWYVNFWKRDVVNVLDTTQLANTPIFAVYNSAIGISKGIETRIEAHNAHGDVAALSATVSQSEAGGISGGTFLVCPPGSDPTCASDLTLQPEDHDQTVAINGTLTRRIGQDKTSFVTLSPQYGTGYPVAFLDGSQGRLPPHLTFDTEFGRDPGGPNNERIGYNVGIENIFNRQYVIKENNGFNSTQFAAGITIKARLIKKF